MRSRALYERKRIPLFGSHAVHVVSEPALRIQACCFRTVLQFRGSHFSSFVLECMHTYFATGKAQLSHPFVLTVPIRDPPSFVLRPCEAVPCPLHANFAVLPAPFRPCRKVFLVLCQDGAIVRKRLGLVAIPPTARTLNKNVGVRSGCARDHASKIMRKFQHASDGALPAYSTMRW